jgi:hypothetical protein
MATVTVFTADRMQQIENDAITSGVVDDDGHLILTTRGGAQIDAGHVVGTFGGRIYVQQEAPEDVPESSVFVKTDEFYYELPVGGIVLYSASTPPEGFLLCDGAPVERTSYPDLFDIVQTTWGAGNGTTTFNVPNLMDKAITPTGKTQACVYIIRAL